MMESCAHSLSPIILHGNNFDQNRGCQALRLTTQMILDRYLPGTPRLHANIFRNDDPQFLQTEPDPGNYYGKIGKLGGGNL